ncbi:MAG: aldehyde dehydrogenase [Sulfobacillus benefaciens]|uniref:Aldehyde dehydrogenase n=1 Tax=Sulfobacillus benefaciens TaxID=453960 RepID=A0A2T2XHA4_9FIRM|nr:MAG: aldehyde dehydrogenase [Sulfobacillus benefaciens]
MTALDNEPFVSGKFLVAGQWVAGRKTFEVHNPARVDNIVGLAAWCSAEDVLLAIEAAWGAFASWKSTDLSERIERTLEAAKNLRPYLDDLAKLLVRENGKVLVEAKKDVYRCDEVLEILPHHLNRWFSGMIFEGTQHVEQRRRPRGVTAIISPWNSPMILTFKRVIPAILTGNTVVVKPPSYCPLTIMEALKVVAKSFPDGVLNIVTGPGAEIGEMLATHPAVKTVSLIGGTETGKTVMRMAAPTLKKLYLELGGNDPAIILPDAALSDAEVSRLKGAVLRSAGQVCSAVKRIYVHRSRYEELVAKLTTAFDEVTVGDGLKTGVTMGPLNNKAQYDFVTQLLNDTRAQGRTMLSCGQKESLESWDQGYFVAPTIVADAENDDELVQCEQFGPVIPIVQYDDIDQAVTWANQTPYGLRASIWGGDLQHAQDLAQQLEAGAVFYNQHGIFQDLLLDFPGVKESGVGRETIFGNFELFCDTYGFAHDRGDNV